MNLETIVTAVIAGVVSPLIALIPMYWKIQQDTKQRKIESREKEAQRRQEDTDISRKALGDLVRSLSEDLRKAKEDNGKLEDKLDDERDKRRKVEEKLATLQIEFNKHVAENHQN